MKAIALGVLQGLTEFLPVSSSGHLVIAQQLFPHGISHAIAFDVCLHFGTLVAVVLYFRNDLFRMAGLVLRIVRPTGEDDVHLQRWIWLLALATVPIAVIGFSFAEYITAAFTSLTGVGLALFVTAWLLYWGSHYLGGDRGPGGVRARDALLIGIFQAFAIIPGISRAGATITGGLLSGLKPATAARFSFLLSLPAITAAVVGSIEDVSSLLSEDTAAVVAGTVAAGITGWLAIEVMMRAVRVGRLAPFVVYCTVLGCVTLLMGVV